MRFLTAFVLLAALAAADTITLRDGRRVTGSYFGGDARSVRIAVGDRVESYPVSDITGIAFDNAATATAAPAAPAPRAEVFRPTPQPAPAARNSSSDSTANSSGDIPSGAVLSVRMIDSVDSERDTVGQTFRASLDEPVLDARGSTLVPRGADVVVKLVDDQQAGKIQGRTVLTLDLVSLRVNGRDVDIDTISVTEQSESRTARSGKVIGGTAALGAIIGAIAGGGKGAAIGAASGAGAGTAVQVMTKGQRVRIPSETRLTFTLQQPVRF